MNAWKVSLAMAYTFRYIDSLLNFSFSTYSEEK